MVARLMVPIMLSSFPTASGAPHSLIQADVLGIGNIDAGPSQPLSLPIYDERCVEQSGFESVIINVAQRCLCLAACASIKQSW